MSLKELAAPLIARGIRVVPAKPGERKSELLGWPALATTDPAVVERWDKEYPGWNLVCMAHQDDVAIVDFDNLKAAYKLGLPRVPSTFIVKSPKGYHAYFRHTEESRMLGSRVVTNGVGTIAEFKDHRKTCCAPGCTRADGGKYEIHNDVPLLDFPPEYVEWFREHNPKEAKTADCPPVHEDFDFEEFCDFYGIETIGDGPWFSLRECPVKGDTHTNDGKPDYGACAIFFDGEFLKWKSQAANCEGASMSIGQVIKFLNAQKGEAYPGVIWEEREEEELDLEDFAPDDSPLLTDVFPNAQVVTESPTEKCYAGPGNGCLCGGEHMYPQEVAPETEPLPEPKANPTEFALVKGHALKDKQKQVTMVARRMSDIPMREQKWLWPGRIPDGTVALFTGPVAKGKSTAALDLIARITTGRDWPDGAKNTMGPRKVLLAVTEDDIETAVKPRLAALDADMNKIIVFERVEYTKDGKTEKQGLSLKEHTGLLRSALLKNPEIALVVLDPITGFYGNVDGNDNKEIRPMVQNLAKVCREQHISIIALVHENKRSDVGAVNKILGAGALSQVVRSGLRFSSDPEQQGGLICASIKSNLTKSGGGIRFKIEGKDVLVDNGQKTNVGVIVWGETHDLTADEVMGGDAGTVGEAKPGPEDTKTQEARSLLYDHLVNGPRLSADLWEVAEKAGIKEDTWKKAKYQLKLEYKKATGQRGGRMWCRMPNAPGSESWQVWWISTDEEDAKMPDEQVL